MITNNAEALLKQMLTSGETLGLMAIKDVSGTTRYLADYTAYPNTVAGTFTLTAADAGISVGSGSTTPAKTDYQLATPVTSGLTGTVLAERDTDNNGNAYVTFTVTLTNTSGSDISISEIGYKQELSATSTESATTATDHVFLLDRATFTSITLASGEGAVLDYRLKSVITNNGGAEGTKAITTNGTYNAIDDDLDGYSSISVNVQPNVGTKNITANGTYNASSDSYDGYSSVTVSVSPNVGTKNISANGTYNASSDSYDGYSSVTVAVSPNVGSKSITTNGNYNASSDSLDGYSSVAVNVSPNVDTKNITVNGTYNASSENLDGYSSVVVNVSGGGHSDVIATPNMTSNTTPSGIVSASSYYNNNYEPWYAFCGIPGYDTQTWVTSSGSTIGEWIQYQFTTPVVIKKLATINRNEANVRAIKTFTFQASNDGTTFVNLKNCYITSSVGHYRQEFIIENSTAYTYYRLYITEPYIPNDIAVGFAQIQMYKDCVLGTKTITQNNTYEAQNDGYDGYSEVTVNVSGGSPAGGGGGDILLYEIVTKSTGNFDASVTVNKYLNNNLQTSTDYLYEDAGTPINLDGYIELDYGVTHTYEWTYTLLKESLLKNPVGFSRSWRYDATSSYGENFLIGGKGIAQINPFPEGASTITLYNSNGITTTSSSIDVNGTGSLSFSEQQAGYEGFVIELNVTPDKIYLVKFDYQNVDCQYWENPAYRLGWTLDNSAKTNYQDWTQWPENIQRIPTLQHFKASLVPVGTKMYLNFNVCGYSDSRANTAEITNLKVYEISENVHGNWDTIKCLTFARSGIEGGD